MANIIRKIIHIDMDAFFAAVEQRDNPELRGKPVVVGGQPDSRGVVATASYEARHYGIKSAMPSAHAFRLCPHAIFVPPHFDAYRQASKEIMAILQEYTDQVEQVSIDEAYLDVTHCKRDLPYAQDVAREIKMRIYERTKLTASAGVAPNKFLAKIASDLKKPDGLTTIHPLKVRAFVQDLPIRKVPGIGRVTEARMKKLGFHTLKDLQKKSEQELQSLFGKSGRWYWRIARGQDFREVTSERAWKSVSCEDTFASDLEDTSDMARELATLAKRLSRRLQKQDFRGRTITLKVTFSDFRKITRSRTIDNYVNEAEVLAETCVALLSAARAHEHPVRLLGIIVSNFQHDPARQKAAKVQQLSFDFEGDPERF